MSGVETPFPDLPGGLQQTLAVANAARREGRSARREEQILEARFRPSVRLAVYGSLAPGESNHHVIEPAGGTWEDGFVRGELRRTGWATDLGFPAMRWDPGAAKIPVHLLFSELLPRHWARLDRFEGAEYCRILVPVHVGQRLLAVANLYEAAPT